jgi:hypothetical protein
MVLSNMFDRTVREYKVEGLVRDEAVRLASISNSAGEPRELCIALSLKILNRYMPREHGSALPEDNFATQVKHFHVGYRW